MKTAVEISGDTVTRSCYQEISALARLFGHVADEIHAEHIEKGKFPTLDDAIHGGLHTAELKDIQIQHLCQVMQRAIVVLNECEAGIAGHEASIHISGPYWEAEKISGPYWETDND